MIESNPLPALKHPIVDESAPSFEAHGRRACLRWRGCGRGR
ncbi:MAG: hypothetical protein WAW23_11765 [Candidatus Methanoperedens sp.]